MFNRLKAKVTRFSSLLVYLQSSRKDGGNGWYSYLSYCIYIKATAELELESLTQSAAATCRNLRRCQTEPRTLIQTMPVSVAAQELGSSSKKRKRESSKEPFNAAQFVRGEDAASPPVDVKGKGRAKDVLLGEEGVTGARAEYVNAFEEPKAGADLIATHRPGQYLSLDCEFVGLYDPANNHAEHSLARVSIVNYHGAIVLDTFVAQRERVGDWRTWVSGVRPEDVKNGTCLWLDSSALLILLLAPSYEDVQKQVADILKGRVLVGHAVHNDLKASRASRGDEGFLTIQQVLLLSHPRGQIRDTASYGPLRELAGTKRPSLKNLAKKAVGIDIQEGEHSSVRV